MQINISDPITQTIYFSLALFVALILSIKKRVSHSFLSTQVSSELKGLAILAVIFSHLGYYLSSNNRFLFPLSISAGVGVNLFLFLSGYGLASSQIKNSYSIWQFYRRRLSKLYIPLWITLALLIGADYFFLHRSYSLTATVESLIGFFPQANLYINLDSPLWYFTMIIFYYLIFPLSFYKKFPLLSPLIILVVTYLLLYLNLPVNYSVKALYSLHTLAFPLGVLLGVVVAKDYLPKISINRFFRVITILILLAVFGYSSLYSGVGGQKEIEQAVSLLSMFSIVVVFILKRVDLKLLSLFGIYSYEIYLIHWPIYYRYGFLYQLMPAYLASILYLIMLLPLSFLLNRVVSLLLKGLKFPYAN